MKTKILKLSAVTLGAFFAGLLFFNIANAEDCDSIYASYESCVDNDGYNCDDIYGRYESCTRNNSDYEQNPMGTDEYNYMTDGDCTINSDCGPGFVCSNRSCVDEQTHLSYMSDGTCTQNVDCGTGFTCYNKQCVDYGSYEQDTAWYDRAWETTTDFFSGDTQTLREAGDALLRVNNTMSVPGVGSVPAGSTITDQGLVISPDGRELGTISGSTLNSLASTAGSGSGGSIVITTGGGGFPGTSGGIGGSGAKCGGVGSGFEEIGGVCFPSKSVTGLSDSSIMNIVTSLYFWLMMLFSTLAVGTFVVSGIMYVTAAGDEGQIKTAKNNAKWAVIGIIIALSGFIIVKAIATALSGQTSLF